MSLADQALAQACTASSTSLDSLAVLSPATGFVGAALMVVAEGTTAGTAVATAGAGADGFATGTAGAAASAAVAGCCPLLLGVNNSRIRASLGGTAALAPSSCSALL